MLEKDLVREQRRLDQRDVERLDAFRALVQTTGWKFYIELIQGRFAELSEEILEPVEIQQVLIHEHKKGRMYALTWAANIVSTMLATSKVEQNSNEGEGR